MDPQDTPATYRPSPKVLQQIEHITLVVVVGPSGAGKTTLMKAAALEPQIHVVLSDTSRPPRPEEIEGKDYYFRSRSTILEGISRRIYVQVAPSITGDLYVTRPENYGQDGIAMLAVLADAVQQFRELPFRSMRVVFIVPPDFDTWQKRMQLHHFSRDQQVKRLAEAKRSFAFALSDSHVQFVINDDLRAAQRRLKRLALAQPFAADDKVYNRKARTLIAALLQRLGS